ncbi:Hypothetical predicted protein [Olea europaea subsp. europaea]|uniref:Uncharacterized protein n=1 Tax=Olea europaea subsp. europaea TaxID=158383 RepID=A0A8S0PCP8_OLEEU|nr:Hypothetical predicted protein [Olea europaea subsp. europaea]
MATTVTEPDFQAILEVSRTWCVGHVQDAVGMHPDFQVFLGGFWNTVCRQCLGHVWVVAGMQPGFQAFLGSFSDMVCKPCLGCCRDTSLFSRPVEDAAGTQPDFLTFIGSFLEHCVQAMTGTRPATAGMQPDFQAFLGSFWALCASHVHSEPNFQAILGNFWDTVCKPCPRCQGCIQTFRSRLGRCRDVAWIPGSFWDMVCRPCRGCCRDTQRFSCISRQFFGHCVQAMFGTRLSCDRDAA